jgi:hypothetical protein
MRRALAIAMGVLVTTLAVPMVLRSPSRAQSESAVRTPEALRRPADQTYLTYPEWFLVFSPEEYADWVEERPPTDFPFLRHVIDVWAGYADITGAIPASEPTNWGYHAMIWVIAGSTTAEYAVRAIYESSIGRVSAATVLTPQADGQLTNEDRFGATVAREYERFLRQAAWYDYDWAHAFTRLWTEVPFTWSSPVRAIERRYWLSTEYLFKLGYAQLLRWASHTTFDEASFEARTSAVVHDLPDGFALREAAEGDGLRIEQRWDDGAMLVTLPRYQAFLAAAHELADAGVSFEEIAGNRGRILVSMRAEIGWTPSHGRVLRRDAIGTQPGRERILFDVPIAELAETIRGATLVRAGEPHGEGPELEHVYDF